jgi:putative SOS response-associated peptidase YedK
MPAILSPSAAKQWLTADLPPLEKSNLLQPYAEEWMLDHSISRLINSRRETMNQESILEKQVYPELENVNTLNLFSDDTT